MRRVCSPLLVISSALPRCPGTPANLRTALLALWLAVFPPMLGATPWLVDGRPAPAAQQAVDSATRGFEMGKFNFLEVLDAKRTLIDARSQYLVALAQSSDAWVRIERIYGDLSQMDQPL